ncbi:MAG: DNA-directed RNA polymerase subunit omega [Kiritimatiellia bacterium]
MNIELIEKAKARVPSVPVLVNLVSKRVDQLNRGERPFVKPLSPEEDRADLALREIAEGLIVSEIDFDAIARAEQAHTRWSE